MADDNEAKRGQTHGNAAPEEQGIGDDAVGLYGRERGRIEPHASHGAEKVAVE